MTFRKPRKLFLLITLFSVISDGLFVWINYQGSKAAVLAQLSDEMAESKAVFDLTLDYTMSSFIQLATYIAGDQRVQQLFLAGKEAVEQEGGGPGGERAAEIRQRLYELVRPGWERMQERFRARQLHFHLGPGSTSFLRVHKPGKFGDNMDTVRYTIVDANHLLRPTRGFETGRVYSGIRSVVPVFAEQSGHAEPVHVGALEAGTAFPFLLDLVESHTQTRFAILLTLEHMRANVWPEFLDKMLREKPPIGNYFIEASSDPAELRKLLTSSQWVMDDAPDTIHLIPSEDRILAVTAHLLLDYHSTQHPELGPVGMLVSWRDASKAISAFHSQFRVNVFYAVIAFILLEVVLFFGINRVTRGLQKTVDMRTGELSEVNEALSCRNKELVDSIEELGRTRDQLIASEKLASLGGLVAGVAHEINTPVGVGLTASSHMLEKIQAFESINDAGRLTKADLQRFLSDSHRANDIILGNLRRAADLVHSFKQIATDQATETRREFNLADYVDEVLMNLHPRLGKTQIKVAVSCPHEFVIDSYPGALAQVLTNLLINSLEHAFEENSPGQIHMQFTLSAGNRLSVQYRDNGRGIPEASRTKIFEPFFPPGGTREVPAWV